MSLTTLSWEEFVARGNKEDLAVTIGVFDGVHLGHAKLIEAVVASPYVPTVVTFKENPKKIIYGEKFSGDILTLDQKLQIFAEKSISLVVLIDFSAKFGKMRGWEFINTLISCGMKYCVIGQNFKCGKERETDALRIKKICEERGIKILTAEGETADGEIISSSRIRDLISHGDFDGAARLMGRHYNVPETGV